MIDDNIKVTEEELKIRLENELLEIKRELSEIAIVDPNSPDGYSAIETNTEYDVPDGADLASEMSNIHNNNSIMNILIERKREIEGALERMKDGSFGNCEICGNKIEDKRLLINAAATKCIKHMEVD